MTQNEIPITESAPVATIFLPAGLAVKLAEIGRNVATQDNRITVHPIFLVQQKVRDYSRDPVYADDHEITWLYDGEECGPEERAKMERQWEKTDEVPPDYNRVAFVDEWVTVQPFFTEKGAQDYLAINSHNLNEPRIYVDSAYRNREWQTLRAFLLTLSLPIVG